jgi:uncharacterized protein YndB with AHSA1/START domain
MLMYEHEERRHIDATPEELFALLADVEHHDSLAGSGEVRTVRVLTDGAVHEGSEWEADEVVRFGKGTQSFTATSRMTQFAPPYSLAWTSTPPGRPKPKRIEWTWRLEPSSGGGTDVTERIEVDMGAALNVAMKGMYARKRGEYVAEGMRRTLDNLEQLSHG